MKLEIQNTVGCSVTENLLVHGAMKFTYKLSIAGYLNALLLAKHNIR
jgi:hypothetical protein